MKRHSFLNASMIALLALIAFALPLQNGSVAGSALAEVATSSATDSAPWVDLTRQSGNSQTGHMSASGEKSGAAILTVLSHRAGDAIETGVSTAKFIENAGLFADQARFQMHSDTSALMTTTDAQNVELVGQIGGTTYTVAVQGNYAYIGVGSRLVILNISITTQPTVVGQTGILPGIVENVFIKGNYAYVADGFSGLRIIDVSNPAQPGEVGFYVTPGYAWGVAVSGSYAYVADGFSGLRLSLIHI